MTKIIQNVTQGTKEWHELRSSYFTASEAPAMLGLSKYQTRNELLEAKATGQVKEVTEFQQIL
jgi:predicted phage-related endonuclease